MVDLYSSTNITEQEKAALRYLDPYKEHAVDSDNVFDDLRRHFTDEEIIELGILCSTNFGTGPFAISVQVVTWQQACEVRPSLVALNQATEVAIS